MNQRGEYGRSRRTNGHSPYGSPGWQAWCAYVGVEGASYTAADVVKQIDAEMDGILDALYREMGADPTTLRKPAVADEAWMQRVRAAKAKAQQSPLWAYWESTFSPKYADWRSVRENLMTKMMGADYDLWMGRVKQLRAEVMAKGIKLGAAQPLVAEFAGPETSETNKFLKWGLIGGLVIGGVVLVSALASSTKKEREPYERYRYGGYYLSGS